MPIGLVRSVLSSAAVQADNAIAVIEMARNVMRTIGSLLFSGPAFPPTPQLQSHLRWVFRIEGGLIRTVDFFGVLTVGLLSAILPFGSRGWLSIWVHQ